MLNLLGFDEFRVSRHQADTLDFNKIFCYLHSQKVESASKHSEFAEAETEVRSEEVDFTSIFGAVKQKPIRELMT